MISARVVGAREAARAFLTTASTAAAKTNGAVAYHGKRYQASVRRRASGRPGPNIITRRYWNSIQFKMIRGGLNPAAAVGTDEIRGRRLENGFFDIDSAGRDVHAPPYPHFEPDLIATLDALQNSIAAIVTADSSDINVISFS